MTLDVGNIISIIATSLTCIGLGLTVFQLWQRKKVDEAKLVADLQKAIRLDRKMAKVESYFDYGRHWYDDGFHKSENEALFDGFLAHMNYICFLKSKRLMGKKTLKIFEYDLERTISNEDCLCYLWNLYHWSADQNIQCPFSRLVELAKENMSEEERAQFESNVESGFFVKRLEF